MLTVIETPTFLRTASTFWDAETVADFVRTTAGEVVLLVAYAKGNADKLPTEFLNRLKESYDA